MDRATIQKTIDEKGWAFLTQAQKDIYNEPVISTKAVETSPVGFVSSEQGVDVKDKVDKKYTELSAVPTPPPTTEPVVKKEIIKKEINKNKALDGTVGNPISFEDAMTTFGNDFTGLHQTEDGSYIPDSIALSRVGITGLGTKKTPQTSKEEDQLEQDEIELERLKADATKYLISDADLQQQFLGITQQWDARIADMQRINQQREASIKTTGIRLGSRYTGGAGGIFGGIISEEERQGVARIGEFEGRKQAALSAAKQAQREHNWLVYSKQVDLAEKAYEAKQKEVTALNKIQVEQNKILREEIKKEEEFTRLLDISASVSDALFSGTTDINEIFRQVTLSGLKATSKEVSDAYKELETTEKLAPGIVGEWQAAIKADPALKGMGLNDYLEFKDPTRALELRQQQLTIQKLEKDLKSNGIDEDPINMLAFAQQYATTGLIPTGIPKGTFGIIANTAKEIPKQMGSIVNTITGVRDSKLSTVAQDDFVRLNNIIKNTERLKELDKKRIGGLTFGGLGALFGSEDQARYLATRKSIVDDIARMQSGAALTVDEVAFYQDYLPGRLSETFGLGQDSMKKIEDFEDIMKNRLTDGLATNGLSIYGYSKIKIGDKVYTVGDIVSNENGEMGRILSDGSISTQ